jgi:hypothetical protein
LAASLTAMSVGGAGAGFDVGADADLLADREIITGAEAEHDAAAIGIVEAEFADVDGDIVPADQRFDASAAHGGRCRRAHAEQRRGCHKILLHSENPPENKVRGL